MQRRFNISIRFHVLNGGSQGKRMPPWSCDAPNHRQKDIWWRVRRVKASNEEEEEEEEVVLISTQISH